MNTITRENEGSLRARVVHAVKWSASGKILVQVVTWGMTLFVVRLLTPADYGLMSMATVLSAFMSLLNELGLGAAAVQRPNWSTELMKQTFGIVLMSNLLCFAIVFGAAPILSDFFGEPRLTALVRALSTQFLVSPLGVVSNALLIRRLDFKRKTAVEVSSRIVSAGLTVAMATMGYGVWSLIAGALSWATLRSIGLTIAARFFSLPNFSLKGVSDIVRFGAAIVVQRIAWFFYSQADVFIIGRVLGSSVLGFYSVAVHLASLPMQKFNEVINEITFRAFSQLHSERGTVEGPLLKAIHSLSFGAFPLFFGISAVAPETVELVLGPKWTEAILPLQLLSLIMPLRMLNTPISEALNAVGRPDVLLVNLCITIAAILPALYVGSGYGITGVCVAWLVAFPVVFAIGTHRAAPYLGTKVFRVLAAAKRPALASCLMYLAVALCRQGLLRSGFSFGILPLLIGAGAVTYVGVIRLWCWEDALFMFRFLRASRATE